jgi:hypothetical protein
VKYLPAYLLLGIILFAFLMKTFRVFSWKAMREILVFFYIKEILNYVYYMAEAFLSLDMLFNKAGKLS